MPFLSSLCNVTPFFLFGEGISFYRFILLVHFQPKPGFKLYLMKKKMILSVNNEYMQDVS